MAVEEAIEVDFEAVAAVEGASAVHRAEPPGMLASTASRLGSSESSTKSSAWRSSQSLTGKHTHLVILFGCSFPARHRVSSLCEA